MASCTPHNTIKSLSGRTMGTTYEVKYLKEDSPLSSKELQVEIENVLKEVNRQMSTYISDSEISKVNKAKKGEAIEISPWFAEVLQNALNLSESTGGTFDPTLGPLVNLWGFGPQSEKKVPTPDQIRSAKEITGYKKVHLIKKKNDHWVVTKDFDKTYIDLSANAKGFGVDKVSDLLTSKNLKNHLVNIGGEIRVSGYKSLNKPWLLAIETPTEEQTRLLQESFPLKNKSLATSGSYRNFFKENGKTYSHTIDQITGKPVAHGLVSVSIIAETCMEADGLATALMAMGPEKAWEYAQSKNLPAYLIISSDPTKKDILVKKTRKFVDLSGIQ